MARPPLPLLAASTLPQSSPLYLPFSYRAALPRPRTLLPHVSNSTSTVSSPKQYLHPEDFTKTPLEKAVDELRRAKAQIRESFVRIRQTDELFELDVDDALRTVDSLEAQQRRLAAMSARLLEFSAVQIQRCFRGHRGRRLFRQALVVRAVLRIQHEFRNYFRRREERRRKSRVLYRKILRGLRSVKARERSKLSRAELLTRAGHNMQVEAHWRTAMGVKGTDGDLMTALHRKKYVRQHLLTTFRHLYWLHSITKYWKSLLPQPKSIFTANGLDEQEEEQVESILVDDWVFSDGTTQITSDQPKVVVFAPRGPRQTGAFNCFARVLHSQQIHLQRMREGQVKRRVPSRPRISHFERSERDQKTTRNVNKGDELRAGEETASGIVVSKKKAHT